jgi:hypothetical protein
VGYLRVTAPRIFFPAPSAPQGGGRGKRGKERGKKKEGRKKERKRTGV